MGLLAAARFAPFVLVTLPAGVWVDRRRRRPVLIGPNLGRCLLAALVPLLAGLGLLRIQHLTVRRGPGSGGRSARAWP
jgi:hypothetical protein